MQRFTRYVWISLKALYRYELVNLIVWNIKQARIAYNTVLAFSRTGLDEKDGYEVGQDGEDVDDVHDALKEGPFLRSA